MDNLPKELHSVIISFLDAKSRRALRLASTHWFTMVDMRDFVVNFETEEEFRQILQHLKRYSHPISIEFQSSKRSLPANHLIDEIIQLTNVTKLYLGPLDIDMKVPLEDLLPLTKLANLRDEDFLQSDYPPEILRHFSNMRNLSMDTIEYAEQLNLDRFTRLEEVRFGYNSLPTSDPSLIIPHTKYLTSIVFENAFGAINESNLTRFSNLKALYIVDDRRSRMDSDQQREFNIPSLPNLEELSLNVNCQIGSLKPVHLTLTSLHAHGTQFRYLTALAALRHLSIQFLEKSTLLHEWTALTNLESINIAGRQLVDWEASESWDWTQSLLFISSTRLTSFVLSAVCSLDPLLKHSSTLQKLSLRFISQPQNQLKFFTNLTSLQASSTSANLLPAIEALTKLKRLELYQMTESDFGPDDILRLDNLKELEELTFNGNDNQFRIDLTSCQHLPLKKLCVNWIDHQALASLGAITTLQSLEINDVSELDNNSIAMLAGFHNLTRLHMQMVSRNIHRTLLESLPIKRCWIKWEDGKMDRFIKSK